MRWVDRRDLGEIHPRIVRQRLVGIHARGERAAVEQIEPDVSGELWRGEEEDDAQTDADGDRGTARRDGSPQKEPRQRGQCVVGDEGHEAEASREPRRRDDRAREYMPRLDALLLIAYYLALGILAIYSVHRLYLVRLRRTLDGPRPTPLPPEAWPSVTVQLPLFNEPNVAARLINAVASIDYPGRLDIQVLDDSTDRTSAVAATGMAAWQARGVAISHIQRGSREGYKAGALAYGMARSDSQFFAVFDADFVPPSDVLTKMVPHFGMASDRVGMVQARWAHLNREHSLLTRAQAIYLDAHFAVESAARNLSGRFFNFNGTAGIWRREAIDDAGGWSASTLTEDLDLSYRAQLAGWKFVFLPDVEVPAELPAALSGFQEQQHRWAKGSIQTALKVLPRIVRSDLPLRVKSEAFFHLTNNTAYLLSLVVALLMVPAIVIRQRLGITWTLLVDLVLFAASTGSVMLFYI